VVKNEVYSNIQRILGVLFDNIFYYIENGLNIKNSLLKITDKEIRKDSYLKELLRLKDTKELKLNSFMLSTLLEFRDSLEPFVRASRELNNVETKYSKFLSPQLTLSLIKIQKSIMLLESCLELYIANKKLLKELNKMPTRMSLEVKKEMLKMGQKNGTISQCISMSFKNLIEEIYKIHKMGLIEFFYPF